MKMLFKVPVGKFATEDEALKKKREELKKKLLEGKKITVGSDGNVTKDNSSGVTIPAGKLATEDEALKKKREELKKKLLEGKKITVGSDGNVTKDKKDVNTGVTIPAGKLAISQWYEKDSGLLEAEKAAMKKAFPHFELDELEDGRLAWAGALNVGVMGKNSWYIMAVYNNNHPQQVMGSSVRVYLIEPDINELINDLGWQPTHLLRDSNNQLYLCTAEAGNVKAGKEVTSAASVIAWAVKWLMAFELVLTGDLSKEKFNQHGGI